MTGLIDWLNAAALHVGPHPVSRAELGGAALGLAMVACNLRIHPAGWLFALLSALLYAFVFEEARLYGEAALQVVFAVMAVWGWRQWVSQRPAGAQSPPRPLAPTRLSAGARHRLLLATAVLWLALGVLLDHATDSDVPYLDALPTAGSLVATWMLARKHPENWLAWLAVNAFSVVLFAHKALWPTVALYLVFAALSWVGWRRWTHLKPLESPLPGARP